MQRTKTLLQKITDLARAEDKISLIEIDLKMDYTRVLYADLIEWRNRMAFNSTIPQININQEQQPVPTIKPATTEPIKKRDGLENMIGINDKYQFISELFGNNKALYEATINTLNTMNTYQDAANWIQVQYAWSDDNETAQSFSILLERYYSN